MTFESWFDWGKWEIVFDEFIEYFVSFESIELSKKLLFSFLFFISSLSFWMKFKLKFGSFSSLMFNKTFDISWFISSYSLSIISSFGAKY